MYPIEDVKKWKVEVAELKWPKAQFVGIEEHGSTKTHCSCSYFFSLSQGETEADYISIRAVPMF